MICNKQSFTPLCVLIIIIQSTNGVAVQDLLECYILRIPNIANVKDVSVEFIEGFTFYFCVQACNVDPTCLSFAFNEADLSCGLFALVPVNQNLASMVELDGTTYYVLSTYNGGESSVTFVCTDCANYSLE